MLPSKPNAVTLTLHPVDSSSELEPVPVTAPIFAIGKDEPFISKHVTNHAYEVRCLSRKHAAIYYDDNRYILRDLGSTNGTLINGVAVKNEAVPLNDGDVVTFGNNLFCYRIGYPVAVTDTLPTGSVLPDDVTVMMQPVDRLEELTAHLQNPAVEENRVEADSAELANDAGADKTVVQPAATVSKDLAEAATDSKDKRRKSKKSLQLFGRKKVQKADEAVAGKPAPPPQASSETVYIGKDSAGDFVSALTNDTAAASLKIEDIGKPVDRLEESPLKKFALPLLGGALLIAFCATLLVFLYLSRNSEFNKIEEMLAAQRYAPALQAANRNLLTGNRDAQAVSRFENYAQEAFIGLSVPEWLLLIKGADYLGAREHPMLVLEQQQQAETSYLKPISEVLMWIPDLFKEERQGATSSVYHSGSRAMDLTRQWQDNSVVYLALMRRIETRQPSFEPIHRKVVSTIRALQVETDELAFSKQRVTELARRFIEQPDDALITRLQAIAVANPALQEASRLSDELRRYANTYSVVRKSCFDLALSLTDDAFSYPPVLAEIEALQNRVFGSRDDLLRVQKALLEWRRGELASAHQLLLLSRCNPPDGRNNEQEIERMETIVRLLESGDTDDMLQVYQYIDEQHDGYYLERYQDRIRDTRQAALQEMQRLSTEAIDTFARYQGGGGISAAMRISDQLTEGFRRQAQILSAALDASFRAGTIARIINVKLAPRIRQSFGAIQDESKSQIAFLDELRGSFTDRALLDQKRALLTPDNSPG